MWRTPVVLGALTWVGILVASHWFLGKVVAIEPIGVVMLFPEGTRSRTGVMKDGQHPGDQCRTRASQ